MARDDMLVRPATEDDAHYLAQHLRAEDRREVVASSGELPLTSLLAGVRAGPAYVWTKDGRPCVLFGAVPLDLDTASIWMVGTSDMDQNKTYLLRHARSWVNAFNRAWPLLINYADARNVLHHRFIKWCGFTFYAERRVNGLRFLDFARIRTRV